MRKQRFYMRPLIGFISFLVTAGCNLSGPGGDDEWGEPVDQTPDNKDVPEFEDAHQIHQVLGTAPYQLDAELGALSDTDEKNMWMLTPAEREYAAFGPSTPPQPDHTLDCVMCGWPAKPWIKGLPEFPTTDEDLGPLASKVYEWSAEGWGHQQGDLRSGLIGNYNLHYPSIDWEGPEICPDTHPRAPICTPFFGQLGHPFIAGRYTDYGVPCVDPTISAAALGFGRDFDYCDFLTFAGESEVAPMYDFSVSHTQISECQFNGPTYRIEVALLGALERNNSTWANLESLGQLLSYFDEITDALGTLADLVPLQAFIGDEWNYWYNWDKATFNWSAWSSTGTCAFGATLTHQVDDDYVTTSGCPIGHTAVMPSFDLDDAPATVQGFCGMHYYDWMAGEAALGDDAVEPGPAKPIYPFGAGQGYKRAFNINYMAIDNALLDRWSAGVVLRPSPEGVVVDVSTVVDAVDPATSVVTHPHQDGLDLLASLGLEPGDVLQAVSDIDLRDNVDPFDAFGRAMKHVLKKGSTGQYNPDITALWVLRDGHLVLPTYLFHVLPELPSNPAG